MNQVDPHKQGDALLLIVNVPVDVQASELKSQVRNGAGKLLGDFVISATDTAGQFQFTIADTSEWVVGNAYFDIRRTVSGIVSTSDTIKIPVITAVTQ